MKVGDKVGLKSGQMVGMSSVGVVVEIKGDKVFWNNGQVVLWDYKKDLKVLNSFNLEPIDKAIQKVGTLIGTRGLYEEKKSWDRIKAELKWLNGEVERMCSELDKKDSENQNERIRLLENECSRLNGLLQKGMTDPLITTHILRNWDNERIRDFANSLLERVKK